MGKLTVTSFITLDNVVEDPHLWSGAFQSEDTGELNDAVLREADVLLLGRVTYEGFAAAWPSRSGDPFSDKFNAMPKYVVSTTLERADWNNSTIVARRRRRAHPRAQGGREPARLGQPDARRRR